MSNDDTAIRSSAMKQAVEEIIGTPVVDIPVEVTVAQHRENHDAFIRSLLAKYPEMTNEQTLAIAKQAMLDFWPGITNYFNGGMWPREIERQDVRDLAKSVQREMDAGKS